MSVIVLFDSTRKLRPLGNISPGRLRLTVSHSATGRPASPRHLERAVVRRLLIWLSGARPEILALTPTDSGKYVGIGSAVLMTSSMATISMVFALTTALIAGSPPT